VLAGGRTTTGSEKRANANKQYVSAAMTTIIFAIAKFDQTVGAALPHNDAQRLLRHEPVYSRSPRAK
jgi:hypothetical protein